MATVVKPAVFISAFGCHVQPPQEPEFLTIAEPPVSPADTDGIVVQFCDLESAVTSRAMGGSNGHEKLLLNWGDAKNLCYAILKAAADTGDDISKKCLGVIDREAQNAT